MKVYVISDLHLVTPGETSKGLDTAARLDLALDDLAKNHADADLCVFLGDLCDHGDEEAYGEFATRLARVKVPCRVLIGNHDDRTTFRKVMPEVPVDANDFIQSVVDAPEGRLIFLDTFEHDYVNGWLCEKRLAWLGERLAEAKDRPAYIFMHHPPFEIGMRVDKINMKDQDAFHALVAAHGDVRQVISGHTHRACSGVWRGVPFVNVGATHYNQVFRRNGAAGPVPRTQFPILTAVMLINGGDVVVHHNDVSVMALPMARQLFPEGRIEQIIARGGRISA
jgi:3',5'-cyclic-AMP phosphodiesterase